MMNTLLTFTVQVVPNLENKVSGGHENDLFIWISLAAGLLALGLGIYIFTVLNALKKKQEGIKAEIASLLENKSSSDKKAEEVFRIAAERRLDELENRVYAIENPPRTKEWSSTEVVVNKPVAHSEKQKSTFKKGKESAQNERARAGSVTTVSLPVEGGLEKTGQGIPLAEKGALGQNQSGANSGGQKTPELSILPEPQKAAAELPKEELFYAKFPDRKGAFSADELVAVQNGELVYEVKLKDGEGVYEISQDIDAQKYALSDVSYYLSEGCDFINQPSKNSWIINKSAGKLIQSGGTWIIQEKAVIEFR